MRDALPEARVRERVRPVEGGDEAGEDGAQEGGPLRRVRAVLGQALDLGGEGGPVGALAEEGDGREGAQAAELVGEVGLQGGRHDDGGDDAVVGSGGGEVGEEAAG